MNLLLDSHILLWAIYRPSFLSAHAASLIEDERNVLYLSDASLWELSLKLAKGKLEYESNLQRFYERIHQLGVEPLQITRMHIEQSIQLPPLHRDPFDRILIAQAQLERLTLLTIDEDILRYGIQTVS